MAKVGLFFGSFNPITIGHLYAAQNAYEGDNLDEVWFVVSPQNPDKDSSELEDFQNRYMMVELALNKFNNQNFSPCKIENTLSKPSYTYKTLEALQQKHDHDFKIIVGDDVYTEMFGAWSYMEKLAGHELIVFVREKEKDRGEYDFFKAVIKEEGKPELVTGSETKMDEAVYLGISATQVRNRIKKGKMVTFLTPTIVENFIINKGLYGSG